ncbi:hypothetical protein [Streptomyces sp. RP5T]|uniref:hypothetical protein n=1 Tax=Streptomyces sp. RP5T TaxID=2490848 RepID=UPI000F64A1A8|nr:hypothetical protein [Streptomyces sp. RP5T]RRR86372.1 hypothetical protein EHS43_04685 [Streptomyces sp. RP5T]
MPKSSEASSFQSDAAKNVKNLKNQRSAIEESESKELVRKGCMAAIGGAFSGIFRFFIAWICENSESENGGVNA